jgi:hypothetical protein
MATESDPPESAATPASAKRASGKESKKAGKQAPVKGKRAKKAAGPMSRPFPKIPLERALTIPRAIEDKNAGKPVHAADLAKMVGFRQPKDWRFRDLLRAANYYGLISGTSLTAPISLTQDGKDIIAPSSPEQRRTALLRAFHAVDPFEKVYEYYGGKRTPDDEYFANSLVRDFAIPRDLVSEFIDVFGANLKYVNSFGADRSETTAALPKTPAGETPGSAAPPIARKFLDTCFVLMPFGDWFDRYYKDIYSPAIRDAGFEPMRADGIFNTGAVMEQIWTQINNADVLLAELTGKNPNVFYELGLAHARRKPVVFVSGNLDDVPFDLRHLRVVIYDIREPSWGDKLRADIALYLKNAKTEPDKSIPQPYRARRAEDKEEDEEEDGDDL